ncbi:hypothetical protein [Chryseobacterium sp. PCH239]|uniref:hypothetical protein n=1 Tax=Chryseobacterium sp. PCH239 TaxID=2825845 RepID=UPI00209C7837|nr:hypothetical protein [Chryseobacterium sp. PCH239]
MNGNRVISVGIFFDGTGNNGANILSPDKPLNNNESYYGTFSNIYKLYSLFVGDEKYILKELVPRQAVKIIILPWQPVQIHPMEADIRQMINFRKPEILCGK